MRQKKKKILFPTAKKVFFIIESSTILIPFFSLFISSSFFSLFITMQTIKDSTSLTASTDGIYWTKFGDTQKLNSFNYRQWARSIQIFLRSENALAITLGEELQLPPEDRKDRSDWIAREGKALAIIYN